MKIKDGFMIKEIAGIWVVVPIGAKAMEFMSIASLTETGALIWNLIEKGATKDEIIQAILSEYNVDEATARADFEAFIKKAVDHGFLEV
ncbi:MAG: PqqD family protein [Ruminiclostridium sp.]|nr:PqqD family protein [Ruminiclostridium sp.]